jgi:hypothetical protein
MERSVFIQKWLSYKNKGLSFLDCIKELKKEISEEEINSHLTDLFLNSNLDYESFIEEGITSISIGDVPEQQAIKNKNKDYLNDGATSNSIVSKILKNN